MVVNISDRLLKDLAALGCGGPQFVERYWKPFLSVRNRHVAAEAASGLSDFCRRADPDTARAAAYTIGSIPRGEKLATALGDYIRPGRRVLDVGCGFGGFLVAVAKRSGVPFGVELSPHRRSYAEALLADHDITAARIMPIDILSKDFDPLPEMHLIASESVVEHVADPRRFIVRLAEKLAPGGVLHLDIPNKNAIQLVTSDPHYQLPLIIQLPHHSARALFDQHIGGRDAYGMRYDVGEFYPLSWYAQLLLDLDLRVQISARADSIARPSEVDAYLTKIAAVGEDVERHYPTIDAHLTEQVRHAAKEYCAKAAEARSTPALADHFSLNYLTASWWVTAIR